jgi:hypothetical protein
MTGTTSSIAEPPELPIPRPTDQNPLRINDL